MGGDQARGGRKTRRGSGEGGDLHECALAPSTTGGEGVLRQRGSVAGIPPQHGRWQCRQPPGQQGSLPAARPRSGSVPCSPGRVPLSDRPEATRPSSEAPPQDAQQTGSSSGDGSAWARADRGRCVATMPMVTAHAVNSATVLCALDGPRCLTATGFLVRSRRLPGHLVSIYRPADGPFVPPLVGGRSPGHGRDASGATYSSGTSAALADAVDRDTDLQVV